MASIPRLPAYLDESPRDVNLWHVWCGPCQAWHIHGAGAKGDDPMRLLGHRASHCTGARSPYDRSGYELVYGGRWTDLPPLVRRWGPSGKPARRRAYHGNSPGPCVPEGAW